MSLIWEPIQETPNITQFKKRSSSLDLTYLNNIHLNAPKDVIESFMRIVHVNNEAFKNLSNKLQKLKEDGDTKY